MDQNEFINMENLTPAETRISKKLRAVFTSKAFLTATVAFTALAAFSLMTAGIDIFATLFAIGMWLAYSTSKNATPAKETKFLSGTVKAYYIVNIIGIVGLVIGGVALILAAPSVMAEKDITSELIEELEEYLPAFSSEYHEIIRELETWVMENAGVILSVFIGIMMIAFGIAFIISAFITLLINLLFVKKLSKRLKECALALEERRECGEELFTLKGWFMAFGVINAALGVMTLLGAGIFAAVGCAANATAYIALSYAFSVEPKADVSQEFAGNQTL